MNFSLKDFCVYVGKEKQILRREAELECLQFERHSRTNSTWIV